MDATALLPPASEKEYPSYLHRFVHTVQTRYNYWNPLHLLAGLIYVLSQSFGLEPLWKDLSRWAERNGDAVPAFAGSLPRIRENATGLKHDVRSRRLLSAFFKLWNFIGDACSDGADLLAGVTTGTLEIRRRVQAILGQEPFRSRVTRLVRAIRLRIRTLPAQSGAFQPRLKYVLIRRKAAGGEILQPEAEIEKLVNMIVS
ncbi:MAG: hypothetical protein Greene041619_593 [Candidatus Peregrinibacteria bacterium Greene0416_19]|nr:MAG: hypothetical protein Greene041619_593 [Candidatus Peregrinibacteria bacterium Greene0416_19]